MVLSKGRKMILIAVIIVAVLAAAFFGYKMYSEAQEAMNDAIKPLLDADSAFSFADPYDPETSDEFIEEYWNPVKDKSSFHKKFVKQLQEQVIDLSFRNAGLEEDARETNEYGEEVTNAQNTIVTMMPFLRKVSYEEESLRDCLKNYYLTLAENKRTDLTNQQASSEQEQALNTANGLLSVLDEVSEFNDASADYYKIDENDIIPLEEISQHYTEAIELAYDKNDTTIYVKALSKATESPLMKEQDFADSNQIADLLVADNAAIYTLRTGVGGYYDSHQIDKSGVKYYGDFATRTYTSSSHKYDTSAFTPGLWSALSPGQRAEIQSGNSSKTHYYYYLSGAELESVYDSDITELAQSGYGYVFCNPDGSALFVSARSAKYYTDDGAYEIQGDFTKQVEQAAEKYGSDDAQADRNTLNRTSILQAAMSSLADEDTDAVVQAFMQYSSDGTDLNAVINFIQAAAENDMTMECADIIYPYLNLSEQDIKKFNAQLDELLS